MRYTHVLVITQINPPMDMPDMTWPIPLLGDIAMGIYWNDPFCFFLVSQTHTRITLVVNPPRPISAAISYLLFIYLCIRTFQLHNNTLFYIIKSSVFPSFDYITLNISSMYTSAHMMQILVTCWKSPSSSRLISPCTIRKGRLWWSVHVCICSYRSISRRTQWHTHKALYISICTHMCVQANTHWRLGILVKTPGASDTMFLSPRSRVPPVAEHDPTEDSWRALSSEKEQPPKVATHLAVSSYHS